MIPRIRWLLLLLLFTPVLNAASKKHPPSLAVVIVIDQCAYHHIVRLESHFKDGIKTLCHKGVFYTNARHPHGSPTTAVGHATMSTGTVAKDHGVILNGWIDRQGSKTKFGTDPSPSAAVLGDDSLDGKSTKLLLVDTISDVIMRTSNPQQPHNVYSLSHKARAAMAMAGKLGHALWFDNDLISFTSSKRYFDQLPLWVQKFNAGIKTMDLDKQYQRYQKNDDDELDEDKNCLLFLRTPQANQMLLDLAKQCINANFKPHRNGLFLLWVSLSSLDMIGHEYGPHDPRMKEMILKLDTQIGDFIRFCHRKAGKHNTLFAFTADHGVAPIPEDLEKQGFTLARRILSKPLIKAMNKCIHEKYGIEKIVRAFKTNQFFLNTAAIPADQRKNILHDLKNLLLSQPGIKNVWTKEELSKKHYRSNDIEIFFKNQLYIPRSGDLICMPEPYCFITKHIDGTAHRSPYDYDTHVPLALYQPGVLKPHTINKLVWIPQLAATLSKLLAVGLPCCARYQELPGI